MNIVTKLFSVVLISSIALSSYMLHATTEEEYQSEIDILLEQVQKQGTSIAHLQGIVKHLKSLFPKVSELNHDYENLHKEHVELEKQKRQMDEHITQQKNQIFALYDTIQRLTPLEEQVELLNQGIMIKDDEAAALKKEKREAHKKINTLYKEIEQIQSDSAQIMHTLRNKLVVAEKRVERQQREFVLAELESKEVKKS